MDASEPVGLVGQITRWLADQRADDAVAARTRERWLRQQAEELIYPGQVFELPSPPPHPEDPASLG